MQSIYNLAFQPFMSTIMRLLSTVKHLAVGPAPLMWCQFLVLISRLETNWGCSTCVTIYWRYKMKTTLNSGSSLEIFHGLKIHFSTEKMASSYSRGGSTQTCLYPYFFMTILRRGSNNNPLRKCRIKFTLFENLPNMSH